MDNKDKKNKKDEKKEDKVYIKDREIDPIDGNRHTTNAAPIPGMNTPPIVLPAFNPPVPNRAWTEMRANYKYDGLTEEERRNLAYGIDPLA